MTSAAPFNEQQRDWLEHACDRINTERLKRVVTDLTNIHSPTGAEGPASQFMAAYLDGVGIPARYQPITATSGNCIGRVRGSGGGPTLLLYAPIDTHLDADPDIDIPWAGPTLRDDMLPSAQVNGDTIIGLGAANPKSMLCILVEALTCVVEAGVALTGDVIVATCGGGMPWVVPERNHAGVSHGVMHMLSHGVAPDFGIIMKNADDVYYEHPGMAWFKVTTLGTLVYAGTPRGTPGYRSSLLPATKVIQDLEQWLQSYPDQHLTAQVKPQGWITAVRSGWPDKPTYAAAATEIYLDVRTNPDQTNADIESEFNAVMTDIVARHADVEAEWEMLVSCRAARTDPNSWIVQSALRAWEERHGKPYPGAPQVSGQTDAATINRLGIPLARIGYETAMLDDYTEGLGGMGIVNVPDLVAPCRSVIYSIIDCCTRTRTEVGLA